MHKIALFDKPLETDGDWFLPLKQEYGDDLEPYAEGKYSAYAGTQKGQQLQFKADVGGWHTGNQDHTAIDISFRVDGFMEVSGGGEAYQIFATVTQQTLKVYDDVRATVPEGIIFVTFASSDSSKGRAKVYSKLAQGIAKARGGQVLPDSTHAFNIRFDP